MLKKTLAALGFLVAGLMGAAAGAAGPGDCVEVEERDGDKVGLYNFCTVAVWVRACVDSPRSSSSCARRNISAVQMQPGGRYFLPNYRTEGRGTVWYAACAAPAIPQNWRGTTSSFDCLAANTPAASSPALKSAVQPRFPCDIEVQQYRDSRPGRVYSHRIANPAQLNERWNELKSGEANKRYNSGYRPGFYERILGNSCGR